MSQVYDLWWKLSNLTIYIFVIREEDYTLIFVFHAVYCKMVLTFIENKLLILMSFMFKSLGMFEISYN